MAVLVVFVFYRLYQTSPDRLVSYLSELPYSSELSFLQLCIGLLFILFIPLGDSGYDRLMPFLDVSGKRGFISSSLILRPLFTLIIEVSLDPVLNSLGFHIGNINLLNELLVQSWGWFRYQVPALTEKCLNGYDFHGKSLLSLFRSGAIVIGWFPYIMLILVQYGSFNLKLPGHVFLCVCNQTP